MAAILRNWAFKQVKEPMPLPCEDGNSLQLDEDTAETIAIEPNNQPKSPLEKFMVRLCTHHQKQFIRVLNDIYTEVQPGCEGRPPPESQTMDAAPCSSGCSQQSTENRKKSAPCSESKPLASSDSDRDPVGLHSPLRAAGQPMEQHAELNSMNRTENFSPAFKKDFSELSATRSSSVSPKDSSTQGYLTTSNSSSLHFHPGTRTLEGQTTGLEQEAGVRKCEDDKDQIQGKTLADSYIAVKVAHVNGSEDKSDSCLGSQKNSSKAFPEEGWDSGFPVNSPRRADKENALQCSSKASLHQDLEINEEDARPKQENHLHALGKTKGGYHPHPGEKNPREQARDGWVASAPGPVMHKASSGRSRAKAGASSVRTARKNKRASGLRINDYDNQCDVVYISQPITECRLESQRSVSSRRTARKSTRGYYFNGECCELPTVRTLVKSSRGHGPALRTEALLSATQSPARSGGEPSGAAQAVHKEADKRASLRLLSKGAPASREANERAEKESSEGDSLESREAAYTEPLLALSAPPCPDNAPEGGSATTQPLAIGPSAAEGSEARMCQLLEEVEANVLQQASSSADLSGDCEPTEDSGREATGSTPLSLPEAASREEGSPSSEIQVVPVPPAGLDLAPPAGLDLAPPAGLDPAPPLQLPTSADLVHHAEPPASLDPARPAGLDPTPPLQLPTSAHLVHHAEPPASLDPARPVSLDPTPPLQLPTSAHLVHHAEPPASLDPARPAGLDPTPPLQLPTSAHLVHHAEPPASLDPAHPAGLDPTPPLQLPTSADLVHHAEPPASLDPAHPAGLDPTPPLQLSTSADLVHYAEPPASLDPAHPAGLDPTPPLQLPTTMDLALPTSAELVHHAEPPASMDPEPPAGVDPELAGALPGEPPTRADLELPAMTPASMDLETPVRTPASLGTEPPASLQSADVTQSVPADPQAAVREVQESPPEPGEARPTLAELSGILAGETAPESSRLCERENSDGEMPPGPDTSETDGKGTGLSKESPEKKQKKGRRALVASDRRLRSQQSQPPTEGSAEKSGSSTSLQLPCLQIKLSKSPGAKRFRREVHLDGAASVCFPKDCFHKTLLQNIQGPGTGSALDREPVQRGGDENGITTRQTYKSMLAKEGAAERDGSSKDGPPAKASHSKSGEMLEICVEANSDKRSVLLPRESGTGVQDEERSDEKPGDVENTDNAVDAGKVQYKDLTDSPTGPSSKSGSKHVPSKTWKHKKLALPVYNLRHTPTPVDTAKKNLPGKEVLQANASQKEERSSGNRDTIDWKEVDAVAEDTPKFVEWCAEEENQELIADFNAQYVKVQKGWIQLEKEVQPAPKVKNKADKLKEIWKSKKRTRKCRASLEVQKLSPVQMLFMKAFKLSNICRWFLETTETRSLVIVKKLNTRLPGDVPPIKIPLQKYCSSSLYPSSLQAERLKKHLKKFAATTPAKNNLKNQKLWARLRENADSTEPGEAASPNQMSPCETSSEEAGEDRNVQPPPSLPTQASTRILRKYSNLRGKLRAQHRLAKNERKGESAADHPSVESKQSRKSVCINPLMSPKLALQVKADVFPAKSMRAEAAVKGRKGKSSSQEDSLPKAEPQPGRKKRALREGSAVSEPSHSSGKDRLPAKKGSKVTRSEGPPKAPATRKQAALERSSKLEKKGSSKEKRVPKRQLGKGRLPIPKVRENPSKRAAASPSQQGPTKSAKPKPAGEPSTRSQKAADKKPSSGKTLTRSMKKIQESSTSQGKRKLRAKVDCSHSKRTRLDAK